MGVVESERIDGLGLEIFVLLKRERGRERGRERKRGREGERGGGREGGREEGREGERGFQIRCFDRRFRIWDFRVLTFTGMAQCCAFTCPSVVCVWFREENKNLLGLGSTVGRDKEIEGEEKRGGGGGESEGGRKCALHFPS